MVKRAIAVVTGALALIFGSVFVSQQFENEKPGRVQATPNLGAHQGEVFYLCNYLMRTTVSGEQVDMYKGKCKSPADKSTYWIPVLYRNGTAVKPSKMHVYLRNKTTTKPAIFPSGFSWVLGNKGATSPQAGWTDRYFWQCGDTKSSTHYSVPPNCPNATNGQGETALTLIFRFPQCWDGSNFTYPTSGVCTAGKTLVRVESHWQYMIADAANSKMTLSTGNILGLHSGFVNGFDPAVLQQYIDRCIDKGFSCHIRSDGLLPPGV